MTVSICIPTYNQDLYLEQAIRSGIQQNVLPIEIIVSNDCSTDNTAQLIERLASEISILKVIHQSENIGIAKNTDVCLRLAKGDFIVRLDSDDCLSPDFVKRLSELLIKYPEAGYAHADVQEIDQHGRFVRQRKLFRKAVFQSGTDALKATIKGYRVAANILMFRKEALIKVGYYTGRPEYVEDFHLSASLAAAGFANVYLKANLSYYRVWVDVGKVRLRRKLMEILGLCKVFEEVIIPAYKIRGWNERVIEKSRTSIACIHADCLGWAVYTEEEKSELAKALTNLSSAKITRFYIWLYLKGYGPVIKSYSRMWYYPKFFLKEFLSLLRSQN